ncbi:DNA-binding response regulator [Comamonas testosteroni]|uniref:DNA-binding response regulator n=1 Tax=Comamonas testosteroni TaxID=285 RepID=A0A373FB43_COMTE|nr:response regulator transcription factor [Comamonas testosteroni]RGE41401.1 DNA-binding response regulator [Comamonas testosteroni]
MNLFKTGADSVADASKSAESDGGKDGVFDVFYNPPTIWPSFLVGQRGCPVRVAIVDADAHFTNVLQQELTQDERVEIVGKAQSLKDGKRLCRSLEFDVLLLDVNLADGSGFQLLSYMQLHKSSAQSIVVTAMDQDENVIKALEMGAAGYLVKHSWFGNSAQAILQVANGGAAIAPHVVKRLIKSFDARIHELRGHLGEKPKLAERLSEREKDILRMVAGGYTSAEIGRKLDISGLTVNTHVKNIYRKLQVRSRAQAVNHASIFGIL